MFSFLGRFIAKRLDNYHTRYIVTSSIHPIYHVCFGGMAFSYLVALPEELRHLEHKKHQESHGKH
uniref:Fiber protein Fb15 n=1 Tax=Solanum tuberosum TaxID=4113 RepID=M1CSZ5_SOLTU